jgi:RNA polymerase sigma-70 factor (ECF subfamily)
MPTDFDDWFVREILVHERALAHYLQRCWPHRDELHDLRQEVYARVYEAAARNRPASPQAFLFTTARHLMTDRARRGRVVSIEPMGDFEPSNVYLVDDLSPERWVGARQALKRLAEALDRLPDRCREVVWLRRVEELPQKDVARRLGISGKTVEKHLAKGMRLIADHLYGGAPPRDGEAAWTATDEDDGDARQQAD